MKHTLNVARRPVVLTSALASPLVAALGFIPAPVATASQPMLQDLGALVPNGLSYPMAISQDGQTITGFTNHPSGGSRTIRWTPTTGLVDLPMLAGATQARGFGISGDGQTIVGYSTVSNGILSRAALWTDLSSTPVNLGALDNSLRSTAYAASFNGSVIVGQTTSSAGEFAFRWTTAGGMQLIPTLPGGNYSIAASVSADGTITVGKSTSSLGERAFKHTVATDNTATVIDLGTLPGHSISAASAISGNGSIIVGSSGITSVMRAVRWDNGTITSLGLLGGLTSGRSEALAANFDGSLIVGSSSSPTGPQAFVWTASRGMVSLASYLQAEGVSTAGWTFDEARAVSASGSTIAGTGVFNGQPRGFVIRELSSPCAPRIALEPLDAFACTLQSATFTTGAVESNPVVYQWALDLGNGQVQSLSDGGLNVPGLGLLAIVSGANSANLQLTEVVAVGVQTTFRLRCTISNDCAGRATNWATFTISRCEPDGCSPADIAGAGDFGDQPDGTVDGTDFIAFINSFSLGDTSVDSLADIAGAGDDGLEPDGTVDGSDFIAFINAFAIGC